MVGNVAAEPTPLQSNSSRRNWLILALVGVLSAGVLAWCAYRGIRSWLDPRSEQHLSVSDAARLGLDFELPPEATDVNFYQRTFPDRVIVVDFTIGEQRFLDWAKGRGWQAEKIVGSVTVWPPARHGNVRPEVEITDGYCYHTIRRGKPNTFLIVYNRAESRAYYSFHSEPPQEN